MAVTTETAYGYMTKRGGILDCRYVMAKLGTQRKEREYLVQATSDDRIIVSEGYGSKGTIGTFKVDGSEGRITFAGAHFPHLALAKPYEFPPDFIKACLHVCHALDAVTEGGGIIAHQTVKVIG